MQLRTIKKPKRKDDDIGYEYQPAQNHKKNHHPKQNNDKEAHSSNENSNLTNENEATSRHKLRNSCSNYQGKYKKMNSGKYLYKLSSEDKKTPIPKKRQLKHIPNDLINQFKKLINNLHKKEEESLLNKKKKREEGKAKPKYQGRPAQQMSQFHPQTNLLPMQYASIDYLNGYFPKGYPAQQGGYLIQGPSQYMFYTTNTPYLFPFGHCNELKEINKEATLDYFEKKSVVNHIVGAYYICLAQQEKEKEKRIECKKIVPVNMVKLNELAEENEAGKKEEIHKTDAKVKEDQTHQIIGQEQGQNKGENDKTEEQVKEKETTTVATTIQQRTTREQQLNKVNNVINSIKGNKIDELIDKTS